MFYRKILLLPPLLLVLGIAPASAQLFGEPSARTIVLSPGWHLNGPPVRSNTGLHLAVRNDAGVVQDMTVLPNGAITFAPRAGAAAKTAPATKSVKQRKPKTIQKTMRMTPPVHPGQAPAEAQASGTQLPAAAREEARVSPAAAREVQGPAATTANVAPAPAPATSKAPPVPTGPGFAHGVPINPLD